MIYIKACVKCNGDVQWSSYGRLYSPEMKCLQCGGVPGRREPRRDERIRVARGKSGSRRKAK